MSGADLAEQDLIVYLIASRRKVRLLTRARRDLRRDSTHPERKDMTGPPAPDPPAPGCHCVINHAVTPDQVAAVQEQIDYHRNLPGNAGMRAVPLLLISLNGHCPARPATHHDGDPR